MKNLVHRIKPALLVLLAAPFASLAEGVDVLIDYNDFKQQIHGFGGSVSLEDTRYFTDTADQTIRGNLANAFFNSSGLNVSFLRVGNWNYVHNGVWPVRQVPNKPQDSYKIYHDGTIGVMKDYRTRRPNGLIMMTAWSPPPHLKSNGSAYQGYLAPVGTSFRYTDLANWWLNSLNLFNATTPSTLPNFIAFQNEPDYYSSQWESSAFTPDPAVTNQVVAYAPTSNLPVYGQALNAVYGAVRSNYPKIGFIGPDTAHTGDATATPAWKVKAYIDKLGADKSKLAAVSHHLYYDNPSTQDWPLTAMQTAYPWWNQNDITTTSSTGPVAGKLSKYMTEYIKEDYPIMHGTVAEPGLFQYIRPIHEVMAVECANSYFVWNLVWGCIRPDNFVKNDMYYALAHYSKYVNPGDWRVQSSSDGGILATAYRQNVANDTKDRIIVVLLNTNNATTTVNLIGRLKNADGSYSSYNYFSADPAIRSFRWYKTAQGGVRLQETDKVTGTSLSGQKSITMPPFSVGTVIIN